MKPAATMIAHGREWKLKRRRMSVNTVVKRWDGGRVFKWETWSEVDVLSLSEKDRIEKETLDQQSIRQDAWI